MAPPVRVDIKAELAGLIDDLPDLVRLYPEGIDKDALADWLGLSIYNINRLRDLAAQSRSVDVIRRGPAGRTASWYIWPKGAAAALPKLPPMPARLLIVMDRASRAAGSWPDCALSYPEMARGLDGRTSGEAEKSVKRAIGQLRSLGAIQRIRAAAGNRPALYRLRRGPSSLNFGSVKFKNGPDSGEASVA